MTYRSQFLCGQILYTDLSFHILTDCLKKNHTFTSGITTVKFGGYRNKCLSSTLAFQSYNLIPTDESSQ